MRLFDFFSKSSKSNNFDLSNIKFLTDRHRRFENGIHTGKENVGSLRGISVQKISANLYSVAIHNLVGFDWGQLYQMKPKPMKIINESNTIIELRGVGMDEDGDPYSNFGLKVHIESDKINTITLILYDRITELVYTGFSAQ